MSELRDSFRKSLDRAARERADQERRRLERVPVNNLLQVGTAVAPLAGVGLGAAIGSAVPGLGTVAGAGIGGMLGQGVGGVIDLVRGQAGAEDERKQIAEAQRRQAYLQILGQIR